jgi:hypothetical protein
MEWIAAAKVTRMAPKGVPTMTRETAAHVHAASLSAIIGLSTLLRTVQASCSDEDVQKIKRGVGLAIGTIQTELMDPLYVGHPELDDLR